MDYLLIFISSVIFHSSLINFPFFPSLVCLRGGYIYKRHDECTSKAGGRLFLYGVHLSITLFPGFGLLWLGAGFLRISFLFSLDHNAAQQRPTTFFPCLHISP